MLFLLMTAMIVKWYLIFRYFAICMNIMDIMDIIDIMEIVHIMAVIQRPGQVLISAGKP